MAKYSEPPPAPVKRKPKSKRAKQAAKARSRAAAAARKKHGDYSCLVDDAEAALTYLRELAAQQQGTLPSGTAPSDPAPSDPAPSDPAIEIEGVIEPEAPAVGTDAAPAPAK